jgi:hypothetical protein
MNRVMENEEDSRILVLAPRGRDAIVVADVLRAHAMDVCPCGSMTELVSELQDGAGLAFVTEEALVDEPAEPLSAWVARQPPWSDFPFIVLTTRRAGRRPAAATDLLGRLGNVVLLERPLNSETMVSGARSALRTRARQYETRRHLIEQDVARQTERLARAEALRANDALEFALDAAELGTFHCPFPLGPIVWNPTCKHHFWLPSGAEVDFDVFFAGIHEEDRERTRAAIAACGRRGDALRRRVPHGVADRRVALAAREGTGLPRRVRHTGPLRRRHARHQPAEGARGAARVPARRRARGAAPRPSARAG